MNEIGSQEFVMFVSSGARGTGQARAEQDYGAVSDFFTRRKEEVATEWDRVVDQMQDLLEHISVHIQSFQLHQVEFELGFSAEGHLGFIAKAGANGSVRVTSQRKNGDAESLPQGS